MVLLNLFKFLLILVINLILLNLFVFIEINCWANDCIFYYQKNKVINSFYLPYFTHFTYPTLRDTSEYCLYLYRTVGELEKILDNDFYFSQKREIFSYLGKGIYYPHVKEYINKFGRDNVLIIDSHNFLTQTNKIMAIIEDFIGVKHYIYDNFPILNKSDKSQISDSIRKQIDIFYQPHNERLLELLDRKLSWIQ